jgi:hypothetical protein
MLYFFASLLLPALFVFGLYHLLTWFDLFRINARSYWKRVAMASAIAHVLLVTGFFVFAYIDYRGRQTGVSFANHLFSGSEFWRLSLIFDTAPMFLLLGLFSALDRFGLNVPGLLVITMAILYIVGSVQWYFIGGGLGAGLERFWGSLKTGDDEDENWF